MLTCFPPRYSVLTPETYPHWNGPVKDGIKHLMTTVSMEPDQWQLGRSKVFVKSPESVRVITYFCCKSITFSPFSFFYWKNSEKGNTMVLLGEYRRHGGSISQRSTSMSLRRKVSSCYFFHCLHCCCYVVSIVVVSITSLLLLLFYHIIVVIVVLSLFSLSLLLSL